jgi:hypothetical protein
MGDPASVICIQTTKNNYEMGKSISLSNSGLPFSGGTKNNRYTATLYQQLFLGNRPYLPAVLVHHRVFSFPAFFDSVQEIPRQKKMDIAVGCYPKPVGTNGAVRCLFATGSPAYPFLS